MRDIGAALRLIHDATQRFRLPRGRRFLWGPREWSEGLVVCHGDLGPWNIVIQRGRLAGIIDWDLARYANPIEDLVEVAVELGPLRRKLRAVPLTRKQILRRIEALCRGYGKATAEEVIFRSPSVLRGRADLLRKCVTRNSRMLRQLLDREADKELERDAEWIEQTWGTYS